MFAEVIKRVLRTYSYRISDECLKALVEEIENYRAIKDNPLTEDELNPVLYEKIDETEHRALIHVHRKGEKGFQYWIPKKPLNVYFTPDGLVEY